MSSKAQREEFKQYKEDVEKRGKAFFPHAMFHDTVMSLIVVLVIFGLACVWYFTARDGDSGWIGPLYTDQADPGTTSFVPRPDWYFFFLFYLLRIFKWPDSVILGTIGIPTICIILLLALPFMDRRMERRLSRRPVAIVAAILVVISMGVLTYKGATAREASQVSGEQLLRDNGIPEDAWSPEVVAGADLFGTVGCLNCHTYDGQGAPGPGPNLSAIGEAGRGEEYWVEWIRNPQAIKPGTMMPGFPNLTDKQLHELAAFLEASKPGG